MKKLLTVLAVVALVAISFTSCNNGTPAPSATIPAEMYGTWEAKDGTATLKISESEFIITTGGESLNYAGSGYDVAKIDDNTVRFLTAGLPVEAASGIIATIEDGVIKVDSYAAGKPLGLVTEYTPVDATV